MSHLLITEEKREAEMATERTPLIQSVVVTQRPARYSHQNIRRFCTIFLVAVPLVTLAIVFTCIAITGKSYLPGDHPTEPAAPCRVSPHDQWPESEGISYDELEEVLKSTPDEEQAREWSKYYTSGPHLAGKNISQAEFTRDKWIEFGVNSAEIVAYDVYLNYPIDHRLALLRHGKVEYEARLQEDVLEGADGSVPTFHGYSANGNVTASYVFCNYGTYEDFEELQRANISLTGKIALIKYGGIFRGLKVKRASELGMVGAVIYSDPGDDGEITEENGLKPYPQGPARNPSSVQRGSVSYLSIAPGDPTTIGYPSKPGAPRQSTDGKIPDIPSLPISYTDALPLLKALNGHGPNCSSFSEWWQTGGLGWQGVEYNVGPSPRDVQVNLMNMQEYVTTPLWNAIGVINGTSSDEVIVIGNHRDAWIAGGAADPNSGSAALNEVVRSFGSALAAGWKPQRTIVFASWDGEEYALLGSTEWVEEYLPWLSAATVAYINVDVGAVGPLLHTSAAPLLNKIIYEVTGEVQSPNQTVPGQTVRDLWSGHISTIGSGSDFTAFQDFAGIPCIDVGFKAGPTDPVYHYHSNYDSFHWMEKYGDAGFHYHTTIAKIISLLAARLVEKPIIQFNATDYSTSLAKYLKSAKNLASSSEVDGAVQMHAFRKLDQAIAKFHNASVHFDARADKVAEQLVAYTLSAAQRIKLYDAVRKVNNKYKLLERQFLHADGLDGRNWFKHVVFAPGKWTGYAGATYPGLVEAIAANDANATSKWAAIIAGRIDSASDLLQK